MIKNQFRILQDILAILHCFQSQSPDQVNQACGYSVIVLHKFGDYSNWEFYTMSDHSYQIEESHFSWEFHYTNLGNCFEEGIQ